MGNVWIVIYDNINWNKWNWCLKGESFTWNEYPVKPETKLCASTISWSLKIASTGREAPCWSLQNQRDNIIHCMFLCAVILQYSYEL